MTRREFCINLSNAKNGKGMSTCNVAQAIAVDTAILKSILHDEQDVTMKVIFKILKVIEHNIQLEYRKKHRLPTCCLKSMKDFKEIMMQDGYVGTKAPWMLSDFIDFVNKHNINIYLYDIKREKRQNWVKNIQPLPNVGNQCGVALSQNGATETVGNSVIPRPNKLIVPPHQMKQLIATSVQQSQIVVITGNTARRPRCRFCGMSVASNENAMKLHVTQEHGVRIVDDKKPYSIFYTIPEEQSKRVKKEYEQIFDTKAKLTEMLAGRKRSAWVEVAFRCSCCRAICNKGYRYVVGRKVILLCHSCRVKVKPSSELTQIYYNALETNRKKH